MKIICIFSAVWESGIGDAKDVNAERARWSTTNTIIFTLIRSKLFKEIFEAKCNCTDSKEVCYVWMWHLIWLYETKNTTNFIRELAAEGSIWF